MKPQARPGSWWSRAFSSRRSSRCWYWSTAGACHDCGSASADRGSAAACTERAELRAAALLRLADRVEEHHASHAPDFLRAFLLHRAGGGTVRGIGVLLRAPAAAPRPAEPR